MFRVMTSDVKTSDLKTSWCEHMLLPLTLALLGACAANLALVWFWL